MDQRKAQILEILARERPETSRPVALVYHALARLALGTDRETAVRFLEDGLDVIDMFTAPAYARVCTRHRDGIPSSTFEAIRETLTRKMSYRGLYDSVHTENHKVMLAVARLLTAQAFPGDRIEGTRASVAYQAALDWLRAWAASRMVYGLVEFHSPVYALTYVSPLMILRDCATDPEVRRMAEMMVDYLAIEHATSNLNGIYAGGHSRLYDQYAVETRAHLSHAWSYLFCGSPVLNGDVGLALAMTTADSDYRPHPAIIATATDRRQPYALHERHAEMVSNSVPVDIGRYTWMTDSYCLSSLYGASWPDHQHRWSLKVNSDNPHGTIFTNQPNKSAKAGYWTGASEYEHLLQHEGVLLATYHIPAGDPHPLMRGHLPLVAERWLPAPKTLSGESQPQWLFLHVGPAFVAIRPLAPFRLDRKPYGAELTRQSTSRTREYWELTSACRRTGVIVEAARAADWPSFDAFVTSVRGRKTHVDGDRIAVTYTTVTGAVLRLENPGPPPDAPSYLQSDGTVPVITTHLHYAVQRPKATATINGVDLDHADWPLMDCPFVHSDFGSAVIRVEHEGRGVELDFRRWTKKAWG